jgi:hypothetical protein
MRQSGQRRRGGTLGPVLVALAVAGTVTVAAVYFGPRYLTASPPPPEGVTAASSAHQALIEDLAEIVRRSVGVLALHERGATPYVELVLWLDELPGGVTGQPDDAELAVLSHSAILQTITIYRLTADEEVAGPALDPGRDAAFCDRWRAHPGVVPLILARGISDMRVERVDRDEDEWMAWGASGGLQRLRLSLTWAADSVDGPDEASVLVNTVMFPEAGGASERTREASARLPEGTVAFSAIERRRQY